MRLGEGSKIIIHHSDKKIEVPVNQRTTFGQLKNVLAGLVSIPPSEQLLFRNAFELGLDASPLTFGDLAVKWLREDKRCPWDKRVCTAAATYGHLEVLKWVREKGCEWDEVTCKAAAGQGHLEVLKWLREKGCEWHLKTCQMAANEATLRC